MSVESSRALDPDAKRRLEQAWPSRRELGAEVVVTHDEHVADALYAWRAAKQRDANRRWQIAPPALARRLARRQAWSTACSGSAGRSTSTSSRPNGSRRSHSAARMAPGRDLRPAGNSSGVWRPRRPDRSRLVFRTLDRLPRGRPALSPRRDRTQPARRARARAGRRRTQRAQKYRFSFHPAAFFTFVIAKFEDGMMLATYFAVALPFPAGSRRGFARRERSRRLREERRTALFHLTQAPSAARRWTTRSSPRSARPTSLFGARDRPLLAGAEEAQAHPAGSFTLTREGARCR